MTSGSIGNRLFRIEAFPDMSADTSLDTIRHY